MKRFYSILFLGLTLIVPLLAVDREVQRAKPDLLKKMLLETSGNTDLAIDILRELLRRSRSDRDYAVKRLQALVELGALPRTDEVLLAAQTNMFNEALKAKKTFSASLVLKNIEDLEGPGPYLQLLNIQLLAEVKRLDLAWKSYDYLSRQISRSHSDRRVRYLMATVRRLFTAYKPQRFNMEEELGEIQHIQWIETIKKGLDGKDAKALQTVMEDALKQQKLYIEDDKSPLRKNLWREIITKLAADPKSRENFRKLQEEEAKRVVRRWRFGIDNRADEDLLKLWRNFPWSETGSWALFNYANRELARGNPELAARCFLDIQTFSSSARLRLEAETAYFVSLAEQPKCHAELNTLLAKADKTSKRLWFGKQVTLATIIKAIRVEAQPEKVAVKTHRRIQLPRISSHHPGILYSQKLMTNWSPLPWPLVTVQADAKAIIGSAPAYIASYAPDNLETPLWIQQSASLWRIGGQYEKPLIPDLAYPAIGKDRIYSRWSYPDAVGDRKDDLMIFDGKGQKELPAKMVKCFGRLWTNPIGTNADCRPAIPF